jgi:REP element-mobilizing transposase RayT
MERKFKETPPRLPIIFQRFDAPLYFVTFNTLLKRPLLANDPIHAAFRSYAERGLEFNVATGRYVLMPDHVHVFVRIGHDMTLRRWESGLRRCLGKTLMQLGYKPTTVPLPDVVPALRAEGRAGGSTLQRNRATGSTLQLDRAAGSTLQSKLKSFWQPGFFDHLLRRDESYAQKWDYVWRNPVRAKLVAQPEDWPYQGEIHYIDRV